MVSNVSPPSFDHLDIPSVHKIVSIYPSVLKSFYNVKVKGNEVDRKKAGEDDAWRYDELPASLRARGPGSGLSKAELERLVKWKITHQTYRPFLLPQIRKNEAKSVTKCTAEASEILLANRTGKVVSSSNDQIRKALNKVCELSGVGPATGTLILSVYDQRNIPFFEDELYMWLFSSNGIKLKYSAKEYFEILDKLKEMLDAHNWTEDPSLKPAECYEKVAFVCQHWDLVSDSDREKFSQTSGVEANTQAQTDDEATKDTPTQALGVKNKEDDRPPEGEGDNKKRTKSGHHSTLRRSKRQKK